MKRTILRHLFMAGVICLALVAAYGQTTADKYLISAEAGGVGYVEGDVTVSHPGGTGGVLVAGDKVKSGDRVTTGSTARAEIMLNPGSFLRMDENSAFMFRNTSLEDLRINLQKGTAILEVLATNQFRVTVFTPKTRITLMQSGVYRVDLRPDGTGTLSAIEGSAIIGDKAPFILKEARKGNLDGSPVVAEKFDRGKGDLFAMWSKGRSKDMASITKSFNAKALRNSFLGLSLFSCRIGVWAFSPGIGTGFVPCYDGFNSPYGYSYRHSVYGYNPWNIYNNNNNNNNNGGSSGDFKSGSIPSSAAPSAPMSAPAPATAPSTATTTRGGVVDH